VVVTRGIVRSCHSGLHDIDGCRCSVAGRAVFREVLFGAVKEKVAKAMIDMINAEREGVVVDRALLRKCVEVFEAMGEGTLEVYNESFQVGYRRTCDVPQRSAVTVGCRGVCGRRPCYVRR
jgi:hypothetical protein